MINVPATQTNGGAVAAADNYNPYAAYGEQATGGARNIIKFRKGRFFYGQDDIEIPLGTRLIANMPGAKVGWVRWRDGKPTDEVMVLIGDGVAPPRRNELGDEDRNLWETDDRSDPKDPWQFTNHLPLKGPETGEEFLFATSTRGGIGAIGAFAKDYGTAYRQKPGKLPVIELRASDYAHPNKAYGRVDVPVFELADWVDEADLLSAEAGDRTREEPAPEPERAAGASNSANRTGAGHRTRF
ncbi:MAG: hypothetical protein QF511_07020 [Rhodospirillales bacterium]|jgi:hypothetical protein|nr:hypothetical protein [Rhodospirillales bacterium]MEE1568299.1 hypothetical protein [Alphaproteobacteria bacterium]HIJ43357.1 hypothetical protein [Rhodospirillaceae bacterium]MDP7652300.1 hypothetical protein [Rhodospirillales bacterium]HIJ45035.1 hypothetical protein [Rhodospirillaceae bacterium]